MFYISSLKKGRCASFKNTTPRTNVGVKRRSVCTIMVETNHSQLLIIAPLTKGLTEQRYNLFPFLQVIFQIFFPVSPAKAKRIEKRSFL